MKAKFNRTVGPAVLKAANFLKTHRWFIVAFIAASPLIFSTFKDYISPVSWEEHGAFGYADSLPRKIPFSRSMTINVSTPKAFLPMEEISVKVRFTIYDKELLNYVSKNGILIRFPFSRFTDDQINDSNRDNFNYSSFGEAANDWQEIATDNMGQMRLAKEDESENIFSGTCKIYYSKQGSHPIEAAFIGKELAALKPTIDIGSSTELLGKKNNDMIFLLTLVSLFLAFRAEFKKS